MPRRRFGGGMERCQPLWQGWWVARAGLPPAWAGGTIAG